MAEHFTERELQIIRLVCEGLCTKELLAKTGVSKSTLQFHLRQIFAKCGFRSMDGGRVKLVAFAFRNGLVK